MAKLTFEEFWKLSEEDRCDQYQYLSDLDKFRVRLSMNPGVIDSQCNSCKYYHGFGKCDAFPNGIPETILDNDIIHDSPYPGDHGIQYAPIDDKD